MSETIEHFGGATGEKRSWLKAMLRGAGKRCPQCGSGRLFSGYVKSAPNCTECGLDLSGHRADDAPPYVTIMIVGHVLIPKALAVRQLFEPPLWLQFSIWLPAILLATFWLLPIVKGAFIGLQWANRMHGFSGPDADPDADA